MRYILVEAPDPDKLTTTVQRLLDEGWELYGDPMFAGFTSRQPAYAQALTNENDPQSATPPTELLDSREVLRVLQSALSNTVTLNTEQQQNRERANQILSKLAERVAAKSVGAEVADNEPAKEWIITANSVSSSRGATLNRWIWPGVQVESRRFLLTWFAPFRRNQMNKMIPVYALLTAILVTCLLFGFLLLRKAEAMRVELAGVRREQGRASDPFRIGPPLRVEVVNTPTVRVDGPINVNVTDSETLDVNVVAMPWDPQGSFSDS